MIRRRRSRTVYFRLYEDDYEKLIAMCDARRASSVSDLMRSAVLRLLEPPAGRPDDGVAVEIAALRESVENLSAELQHLREEIAQDLRAAYAKPEARESVLVGA